MVFPLTLNPRRVGVWLLVIALYLTVQSLVVEYLIENVLDAEQYRFLILTIDLWSVNAELTIPTWYSTLLLISAAGLLALVALVMRANHDRYHRYWFGLTIIFIYLSVDEGAAIHEILADTLQSTLNLTGFLTFGWQIVAGPLVAVFAVLYLRFLMYLPRHTRRLFILSGLLYVGGALLVEGISANRLYLDGQITFEYLAIATIEECAEMLGIILFIYALLDYMQPYSYRLSFEAGAGITQFKHRWTGWGLAAILVFANGFLVTWALGTTRSSAPVSAPAQAPAEDLLMARLLASDVLVTRLVGLFESGDQESQQVAQALLRIYQDVMIISLGSQNASLVIAADLLPFDRETLVELLQESGETQFIIFETPAVKALTGRADTLSEDCTC